MKNNKLKLIIAVIAISPFLILGNLVLASEVTGNLSTGIGGTVTVIDGVVMVSPTANPANGTFTSAQSVTLTANGALSIHYTIDGSTPTCSTGTTYSGAISVNSTQTIKSISCYQTNHSSSVTNSGYVINLTVNANQTSSLINPSALALPAGASSTSTPSLQAEQNITINNTTGAGTSTVTIPADTIITTISGQNFDATALTTNTPAAGTLSGLASGAVLDGSLQWGIVNLGLQFSNPITLSIYVGNSFNGQTLSIVRSISGSGGWTSDGIVSPATCVVSTGLCTFSATKASYYVAYNTVAVSTPASGGSGGGGGGGGSNVNTALPAGEVKGATTVRGADPANYGLKEGDLIRATGDFDVFIINQYGYKRLFLNPIIFNMYGHLGGWSAVKTVAPSTRDAFITSNYYRYVDSPKVYFVEVTGGDTGIFHWVNMTGESFSAQGGEPNAVFTINKSEFDWYPKGTDKTSL